MNKEGGRLVHRSVSHMEWRFSKRHSVGWRSPDRPEQWAPGMEPARVMTI
jgi:hypothetical protein